MTDHHLPTVPDAGKPEAGPTPERGPGTAATPFQRERIATYVLRFLNRLKTTGKSAHTISAYRNDLGLFSEFLLEKGFDPRDFGSNLRDEWEHFLGENGRRSAASVRRALMSVRTFLHFLVGEGLIEGSPLLEVKSPRQPTHDLLRCLPAQFRTLVSALRAKADGEGDEKAIRDLALVLVLGQCGLKATEAALLSWDDVLAGTPGGASVPGAGVNSDEAFGRTGAEASSAGAPTVAGGTLRIPGPNERLVPFPPEVTRALHALRLLRKRLGLEEGGRARLFFGYLNVSRRTRTPSLHRHGIKFVVYEVCEEILGIPYNSESLRNHAILRWLDQGLTVQQVADLAGYSSLHSLERFARADKALRKPRRKPKDAQERAAQSDAPGATRARKTARSEGPVLEPTTTEGT